MWTTQFLVQLQVKLKHFIQWKLPFKLRKSEGKIAGNRNCVTDIYAMNFKSNKELKTIRLVQLFFNNWLPKTRRLYEAFSILMGWLHKEVVPRRWWRICCTSTRFSTVYPNQNWKKSSLLRAQNENIAQLRRAITLLRIRWARPRRPMRTYFNILNFKI